LSREPIKIVVSGPVGAGKTTLIGALSQVGVVNTDAPASECIGKATTTVALDFGMIEVDGWQIHLYGTPGQERFDFMWEVLCHGAAGLLMLVAGNSPRDFPKARNILEFVTTQVALPYLIGVTKLDLGRAWEPDEIAAFFGVGPAGVLGVDARDRSQGFGALVKLFGLMGAVSEGDRARPMATGAKQKTTKKGETEIWRRQNN